MRATGVQPACPPLIERQTPRMIDYVPALITTVGTLVGSFGGFWLAARSQRAQARHDDDRARREAEAARAVTLEDERHEFQLTTLITLQELTRRMARTTILIIDQDRKTVDELGGYRLPIDDADDFAAAVEFSHNVARVTNVELRSALDEFHQLTSEYSLPPHNHRELSRDELIVVQDWRWRHFSEVANQATQTLNTHLRKEINREVP
jgi:hypothetical protein